MVEVPLCNPISNNKVEPTPLRFRDFKFERRHIVVGIATAVFLLLVGVGVGLVLVKVFGRRSVEDTAFLNEDISWQHTCSPKCTSKFDVPPLLVISLDGFRVEYLGRQLTPAISKVLQCGSHAQHMYPTFPSKTFPNHLAMVTGLYPESHGIVGSHFMDFNISDQPFTPKTRDPIWNTVRKNGKKSATFFWPGSEVLIDGGRPTFVVNYNSSIAFSKRVDQVEAAAHRGAASVASTVRTRRSLPPPPPVRPTSPSWSTATGSQLLTPAAALPAGSAPLFAALEPGRCAAAVLLVLPCSFSLGVIACSLLSSLELF